MWLAKLNGNAETFKPAQDSENILVQEVSNKPVALLLGEKIVWLGKGECYSLFEETLLFPNQRVKYLLSIPFNFEGEIVLIC